MPRSFISSLFPLAIIALITGPWPSHARSAPPQHPTPAAQSALVVVPEENDEVVSPIALNRYLGEFDRDKTPTAEQTFGLKNIGAGPVKIVKLQGSCGCTELALLSGNDRMSGSEQPDKVAVPAGAATFTMSTIVLEPGQSAKLRVAVDFRKLGLGFFRKYAWVFAADRPEAAITIRLDFQTHSNVMPESSAVDFGTVNAGENRTSDFVLYLAKEYYAARPIPRISSTNPGVHVQSAGPSEPAVWQGRQVLKQSYAVTLSPNAPMGALWGSLVLASDGLSIATLIGDVVGDIQASPSTVLFGVVDRGTASRQTTLIFTSKPAAGKGLTVTSSSKWVQARLVAASGSQAGSSKSAQLALEITVTRDAPSGPLEERIVITARNGRRLVVPVIATIDR